MGRGRGRGIPPPWPWTPIQERCTWRPRTKPSSGKPWLFVCTTAGTDVRTTTSPTGRGGTRGLSPSLALDTDAGLMYVATRNNAQSSKPWLFFTLPFSLAASPHPSSPSCRCPQRVRARFAIPVFISTCIPSPPSSPLVYARSPSHRVRNCHSHQRLF